MSKLPKDCTARIIGAEARKLVHFRFPSENWEYHEMTGRDNGLDCTVELVENEEWTNKKIEGQIKGTRSPRQLKNGDAFALETEIKTIRYGSGQYRIRQQRSYGLVHGLHDTLWNEAGSNGRVQAFPSGCAEYNFRV